MKRLIRSFLIILLMSVLIISSSAAEESSIENMFFHLQDMSIDELLILQNEIQKILADKGYVQYEELERGSKGDPVIKLQERLKELGYYTGSVSGKYDSETQMAMKNFEKNNGLNNDGKASQSDLVIVFSSSAKAKNTPAPLSAETVAPNKKTEDEPEGYLPFSDFDYTEFFRYPEKYYGKKIVLKGKAVQVLGSRKSGYQIRLATSGYTDVVYIRVKYDPGFNILEDDRLTVYAEMKNTYTYTTTLFNSVTIPSADADRIILN